jgi:hypothetical protein
MKLPLWFRPPPNSQQLGAEPLAEEFAMVRFARAMGFTLLDRSPTVLEVVERDEQLNITGKKKYTYNHLATFGFTSARARVTVIYQKTSADGETVIYDNQFVENQKIPNFEDLKEKQRVMPKQGRVVCFDGYYWHTSQQPSKGVRCIINYNVV